MRFVHARAVGGARRGRGRRARTSIAKGIPQTLPDGVVSGVLKSPWASNQAIARRRPGWARRSPAIAPAWAVQSPPRMSSRGVVGPRPRRRRPRTPRGPARAAGTRRSVPGSSPAGRRRATNPGSIARSPASRTSAPPSSGRARSAATSPSSRSPAGVRSIPARWPPSDVGTPTMTMGRAMAGMVRHHGSMRIADFALERYFARWEFAVEHLLCASDVQAYPMAELLALADDETRALWDGLELGYTESTGHPLLRREIAALYETIDADEVLTFAGAEEAVFCLMNVLCGPGDHVIVTWPGYQSLYEVARAAGADVTLHELHETAGLGDRSRPAAQPGHACDQPHRRQPAAQSDRDAARPRHVRRRSSRSPPRRAPTSSSTRSTAASSSIRPIACRPAPMRLRPGSRSASCPRRTRWPGLRIGWLASHDRDLLARVAAFKDYTTICSSAPSEILAIIALRARDRGARPVAGDRGGEPRRCSTRSSTSGPIASRGSDRGPARSATRG